VYALFFGCYGLVNRLIPVPACYDLSTSLDQAIPFIPAFIYPFYLVYGMMLIPAFLIRDPALFYRSVTGFSALILGSCLLFLLFPVYVPRPELIPDTYAGLLVRAAYEQDRPVCGFPSLHVAASLLVAATVLRERRLVGALLLGFALLTSAATLFIKQHVLADLAGGAAFALLVDRIILGGRLRRLTTFFRAAALLGRTLMRQPSLEAGRRIRRSRHRTRRGAEYDLYEPGSTPGRTVALLHGMTLKGERDPQLVRLAMAMARSGLRAAAVSLPGLKTCRFERSDMEIVLEAVEELHGQSGAPIAVVAFSVGAGLALRAASELPRPGGIDLMLLFGPYDSLDRLWTTGLDRYRSPPAEAAAWDKFVWLRMVLAYPRLQDLDLTDDEQREFESLLESYCEETRLDRKRDFYERVLKDRENLLRALAASPQDLSFWSIENRLGSISSRVLILHDRNDPLIAPEHAQRIMQGLPDQGGLGHRLLITPLLSHVTSGAYWRLTDALRIIDMFAELYR
jgi:pimeloyl-ACP methyl ester carboxylesterase/membrane-associated phospholipid phosphatase